jgi:predicted nucleic acid-binding protein
VLHVPDACALFNLHNGGVLETAASIEDCPFLLGKAVYGEARSITEELDRLLGIEKLAWIDDAAIPASEFWRLKEQFDLGDGETECLATALHLKCRLVFDDMAARRAGIELIGEARVTGSIGLLRACVDAGTLERGVAYQAYELMKTLGGFLPNMTIDEMFPRA